MQVKLNVDQPIVSWDGTPASVQYPDGHSEPMLLKYVLLQYASEAGALDLTLEEKYGVYDAGLCIARGGIVEISESAIDVLRRLCRAALESKAGLPLPVKVQAKRLVDGARPA